MAAVNNHLALSAHYLVTMTICLTTQFSNTVFKKLEEGVAESNFSATANAKSTSAADDDSPLNELNGVWSYNESFDISKYEDFDHSRFLEITGLHLQDLVSVSDKTVWVPATTTGLPTTSTSTTQTTELPVFDKNVLTNVSVPLGTTAYLHCRVIYPSEYTVSWVRRRDWHILTSGVLTYTNDDRFQVIHLQGSNDWDLQIKFVQKRDNGTYECQVATPIGRLSHYFHLHVIVPSAFIVGNDEYHIGEGSTISLVCIIHNSPTPPEYIFWYHNDQMINYDTVRGGITVTVEPGPKTYSRLIVTRATQADSGNYSCRAPNTLPDAIHVFVTKEGDNTAAIQRLQSSSIYPKPSSLSHNLVLFYMLFRLY